MSYAIYIYVRFLFLSLPRNVESVNFILFQFVIYIIFLCYQRRKELLVLVNIFPAQWGTFFNKIAELVHSHLYRVYFWGTSSQLFASSLCKKRTESLILFHVSKGQWLVQYRWEMTELDTELSLNRLSQWTRIAWLEEKTFKNIKC